MDPHSNVLNAPKRKYQLPTLTSSHSYSPHGHACRELHATVHANMTQQHDRMLDRLS